MFFLLVSYCYSTKNDSVFWNTLNYGKIKTYGKNIGLKVFFPLEINVCSNKSFMNYIFINGIVDE